MDGKRGELFSGAKVRKLLRLWNGLTQPSEVITDQTARSQAWMLSVTALGLLVPETLLLVIAGKAAQAHPLLPLLLLSLMLTISGYGLSRTKNYRVGVGLLIVGSFVLVLVGYYTAPELNLGFAILISILLTSQFCPLPITLAATAVGLAALVAGGAAQVQDNITVLILMMSVVALVLIQSATRRQIERNLIRQRDQSAGSEKRLRAVLENMPVMLDAFDENWVPLAWNKECERVTGYMAEEIIGNFGVMELFTPRPEERQQQMLELQQLGNYYRNWEGNLTCKDGTVKRIAWSNIARDFPIPGWPVWGIGIDVTAQRVAETRRLELAVERERVQMLQRFIGDVSHDLLTPITVLKSSLHLLNRHVSPQKQMEHTDRIGQQVELLEKMIQDMLMMSRLDKPVEQEFGFRLRDINDIVQQVMDEHLLIASGKQQVLELQCGTAIPPVWVDENKLRRALANLLDNALKYTPEGGRISVSTGMEGNIAFVEIRDTGSGIAAEDLPHIFERFYRGEKHRPEGGTGLGLAIAYRILQVHGGSIDVESEWGRGSTFSVLLPVAANNGQTAS